jgi:tRNA A-37 threonylcarbamoyl transferase component Bud32/FixJ family two-component response regulator
MSKAANESRDDAAPVAVRGRDASLCLIVHDDLDLRLRLAALVRRAFPKLDSDSLARSAFEALAPERIGGYLAVFFIVEFQPSQGADPLANLVRLHNSIPRLPIFVFARGGDERTAARSMKAGALDYWPIYSVNVGELKDALQPLLESAADPRAASSKPVDRHRQPEIAGYRLLKKIAVSAAATVYLAKNDELAQPVALKVQPINGSRRLSEADRKRFLGECKILSTLNHRAIADVLDFGVTDDHLFLALEYFPCGSLRERLKNPVSEADAVNYARQIGEVLQVVHAARIVHRDLKPSNIMLTNDNRLVLIDFGSALSQILPSDRSRDDLSTGTPYYVCPEQIEGRDPDARGDLYSLGIVLFEMLAGTVPFVGNDLRDIFTAHRLGAVPRLPSHLARHQPIVDRLLAKDPRDRYASASLFLEALAASSTSGREPNASHYEMPASMRGVRNS